MSTVHCDQTAMQIDSCGAAGGHQSWHSLEASQTPYVLAAMRYAGKSAFVTGAGSGIGRELVLELVRRGCTVTASIHYTTELEPCAKQRPGKAEGLAHAALLVYSGFPFLVNGRQQTWTWPQQRRRQGLLQAPAAPPGPCSVMSRATQRRRQHLRNTSRRTAA